MDKPEISASRSRSGARGAGRGGDHDLPASAHAVPDPVPDPDYIERDALVAAQDGDSRAFAHVLREHDPALRTVATFLVGPDAVDEVLRGAYLRAFRGLPRYDGEVMPRLWLTRPVVSVALDHLRKRHRSRPRRSPNVVAPSPPPPVTGPKAAPAGMGPDPEAGVRIVRPSDGDDPPSGEGHEQGAGTDNDAAAKGKDQQRQAPDGAADDSESERVRAALDGLLLEDRVALTLVDVAGLAVGDAARTIEVSKSTVASRLARARHGLHEALDSTSEGEDLTGWFDALPVPRHSADFWDEVGKDLLSAKRRPAAPGPDPGQVGNVKARAGPEDGSAPTPAGPTVGVKEAADRSTIEGLARQSSALLRNDRRSRLRSAATVVAGLVAVGLLGWAGFVVVGKVTHHDTQLGTTPAKVLDRVNDAMAADQFVSGTATIDSGGTPVSAGSYHFAHAVDGSYIVTAADGHWSEAYDATSGTFTTLGDNGSGPANLRQVGVSPGPPDPTAYVPSLLGDPMTGAIRLLRQGHNTQLTSLGNNGAPQYVIDADLSPVGVGPPSGTGVLAGVGAFGTTGGADHVRVVIDQSMQLPVDVQLTRDRGSVMHLRLTDMSLGAATAPDTFRLAVPKGTPTVNRGYVPSSIQAASAAVGYQPVTPSYLPSGFTLASVMVQPAPPPGATTTAGNRNPPDSDVVVMTYRHGGDTVVVSLRRLTSAPGRLWMDPLAATGDGATRPVSLTAGKFLAVGATAGDRPIAHLWGHDRDYVFTVAGTVSQAELTKVASSLS